MKTKTREIILVIMLTPLVPTAQLRAQDMQALSISGAEKANHSDYKGALLDFAKGLEQANAQHNKQGIAVFSANVGTAYNYLNSYFKALDYFSQALKVYREIGDKDGEATTLANISVSYRNLGDYIKALDSLSQALQLQRKIGKNEETHTLGNIGAVYLCAGEYSKSLEYYSQALTISRKIGDKKSEAGSLGDIGTIYQRLGDYPKALDHYSQALKLAREIGDKRAEGIFGNIGVVYQSLGDYSRALDHYSQALKMSREIGDRQAEARNLGNIGTVYQFLGDYSKALDYYAQALEIARALNIPTFKTELNIGDIHLAQGKLAEAFAVFQRLQNSQCLGRYHLIANQPKEAKRQFVKVISAGKQSHAVETLLSGYLGLGLSLEQLDDVENSTKARTAFNKAITMLERQRETLPPAARGNFISGKILGFERIEAYEGRIRTMENPADGFFWSESTKARFFIEALAANYTGSQAKLPRELAREEDKLVSRLAALYKQEETAFQANNQGRLTELGTEIRQARKEQTDFITELRKDYPEYAAIQYPQPLKPEEIALDPGEVLLEYAVTGPKTLFFVVSPGKPARSIEIAVKAGELKKLVLTFRKSFENPLNTQGGFAGKFAPMAGARLYKLLLKPALADIPKDSKLIIVPDKFLGLLPFETLVRSDPAQAKAEQTQVPGVGLIPGVANVRYLSDDYDIAYAQSATALTLARTLKKEEKAKGGLFVLADPIFDKSDDRVKGSGLAAYVMPEYLAQANDLVAKMMSVGGTRTQEVYFERLKQTSGLADSIKEIFGKGVVTLKDKNASEAELREQDLSRYKYLVFATHGILDTDVPYIREPALVLNQLGNGKGEDGFLTMSEVMGLKLKAELVALTACKTGMGRQVSGEGVMGLGRAFQYAGAKNVLVSLWSVAEQSTTIFAENFFRALEGGKTPREALKSARAEIRAAGYEHPFFWAPFILMTE